MSTSATLARAKSRAGARGLTLIELAIVVTIIGILASLAFVGFRALVRSSHTTEGTQMVSGIRIAQETYHSETGQYANISKDLNLGSLYPNATPTNQETVWGGPCTVCPSDVNAWKKLPVHANGAMLFGYGTVAGTAGTDPGGFIPGTTSKLTFPTAAQVTGDWYVAAGVSDQDANKVYCTVVGTSWNNQIYVENDGE